MDAIPDDAAKTDILLVGANPCIRIIDDAGETSFFASLWQVDWSPRGSGTAAVVWCDGETHVYGADLPLARWLESAFTRHFPEVDGLPWPEPRAHEESVALSMSLAWGLRATSADLKLTLGDVAPPRAFHTDDFRLSGKPHQLSLVLGPCTTFACTWRNRPLNGRLEITERDGQVTSSAFVTEAEVWRSPTVAE